MGGKPDYALVTIIVPPDRDFKYIKNIYQGIKKISYKYKVKIIGGETSSAPPKSNSLIISINLIGNVKKKHCVYRHNGKNIDDIWVTGNLGNSLKSKKHLLFEPRLNQSRWLVKNFKINSMIDISDGLAVDLPRIAKASKCNFDIYFNKIPKSKNTSLKNSLTDGEDYELIFTLNKKFHNKLIKKWHKKFPSIKITNIGKLCKNVTLSQNKLTKFNAWDHFNLL